MEKIMQTLKNVLLLLLLATGVQAQNANRLSIPGLTGAEGTTINLPIEMDNMNTEIVAMQFDLSVPAGVLTLNTSAITLSERCEDHTVVASMEGNGVYKVMVYSPTNKPFKANSGTILDIGATIGRNLDEGADYPLELSDVVLSDAEGRNVATSSEDGTFSVQQSPDFTVSGITASPALVMPGDTLSVGWQVDNAGGMASSGGWSERLVLVSGDGNEVSLGTFHNDTQILPAGGAISRRVDVVLPALPGIEGGVRVKVSVVPNSDSGEGLAYQKNNTAVTDADVLNIGKRLQFVLPVAAIEEGSSSAVRCQLSRSGSWVEAQTFSLAKTSGDGRVAVPESVTIPQGQSSTYFYLTVSDNDVLDDDSLFTVQASGGGYEPVSGVLVVEDDELPQLSLAASREELTEGESFRLTVTAQNPVKRATVVELTAEYPKRFTFPSTVTIPAGETSAVADVAALDNDVLELQTGVVFKAVAEDYLSGECVILLNDNDLPAIELELSPSTVAESAGPLAILAKLRRTTNTNQKITVQLSDDSGGDIYYATQNIVLEEGVEEAQFSLGVIDNADAEGSRQVNITAAVYVASCDCAASGTNVGVVTKAIDIIDDDGPSLGLVASKSTLLEGDEEGIVLTVKRNTGTDEALGIHLSSDYEEGLSYAHDVTIPAGASSADVLVKASSNEVSGDDKVIVFTAETEGFALGTCWVMLTDQTLPDVTVSAFSLSSSEVKVGGDIEVSITLSNVGAADLPELTPVGIYMDGAQSPVETVYLQQPLAAGQEVTLSKTIMMPDAVGIHEVYAVANDGQKIKELLYANNTSEKANVGTVAPFSVQVSADKATYRQGEEIMISGHAEGDVAGGETVEVYVINEGYRHVMNVETDEHGDFTVVYKPYEAQMGHFVLGACYPGEGGTTEQAAFDVYGLKPASNAAVTCETLVGEAHDGTVRLTNPGASPLTGIQVEVLSKPENCEVEVTCPESVEGGGTLKVNYSLLGQVASAGNDWEQIRLQVETAEGASRTLTLYYYCRNASGKLQAGISQINTTMVKGVARDYPFVITNVGKGETGKITLALPSWMKVVTPAEMASLAYGDSATVVLRFIPTDEMQLNVPVTGRIGVNCENGEGLSLAYAIEPVSESVGTLDVDVCDENTYYTNEAPHVAGAQVLVKHPTTGAVVARGLTGEDGLFKATLPEGYYALSVSADNHDAYRNNILVDPGKETRKTINLSLQAITVDWRVEETEIEDEYRVETTVKFETSVPVPVVELSVPSSIAAKDLQPGESLMFHATLTNKGLITAQDVELLLPTGFSTLSFEALSHNDGPFALAPQQSVTIPVKVTKAVSSARLMVSREVPIDDDPCVGQVGTLYFWDCGLDRKWHRYGIALQLGTCNSSDPSSWGNPGSGTGSPGGGYGPSSGPGGGGGGGYYGSSSDQDRVAINEDDGCEPCQNQLLIKMVECGTSFIPIYGCVQGVRSCRAEAAEGQKDFRHYTNCTLTTVGCAMDACAVGAAVSIVGAPVAAVCEVIGGITNVIGCLVSFTEPCDREAPAAASMMSRTQRQTSEPSYLSEYREKVQIPLSEMEAYRDVLIEYFGEEAWVSNTSLEELFVLLSVVNEYEKELLDAEDLLGAKPEGISKAQFLRFIERMNNTTILAREGAAPNDNYIHDEVMQDCCDEIGRAEEASKALGYSGTDEMWVKESEKVLEQLTEASNSVCSSITLQLSQTMTMTRQAFRGTLTVFNGNEEKAMENVRLNLEVRDESGVLATSHEFQINAESLEGFTGEVNLTDGWSLAANETGVATVLFIPTKYAALETDRVYSFGGSLTYVDPFTDLEVTRDLYPVSLTVKPSPNLDLAYFMQRDVLGDDPLTADVVEKSEPAEFALVIHNKGYGDATNVRMVTNQPEIVDNEKGLRVDFELLSSQLNGEAHTLALGGHVATEFGTIPAHSQAYAQWWLQSALLGHFTEYDVKATHVTSYGNEDLSLLDNVTIHELVHGFTVDGQAEVPVRGFLVNDIVDAEDLPDMVYFTDGRSEESLAVAASASMRQTSDTEYSVTVTPSAAGWNYGSVSDLTAGKQALVSVVRQSDGVALPVDNFWLTDRTLRDGKDPLYEYRLHFAVETDAEETYLLTFEPKPATELAVEHFAGVPENGGVVKSQVKSVNVTFNKPIDASTFTADDVSLTCQGSKVDLSSMTITKVGDAEFTLGFNEVTAGNGYYVLTVQAASIIDAEGFAGVAGKSVAWNQFMDGKVMLVVISSPEEGGTVSPASGAFDYGTKVKMTAVPSEGYEFAGWMQGDELVSEEVGFVHTAVSDEELTALFMPKHFNVSVVYDETCGVVEGDVGGIYEYGTSLSMTALPFDSFVFSGWFTGDEKLTSDDTFSFVVREDVELEALFAEKLPTGIDAEVRGKGFVIRPLPLGAMMYLDGDFTSVKQLLVYGIDGTLRLAKSDVPRGEAVDVSSLGKGMYIIRVITDNGVHVKSVFKK